MTRHGPALLGSSELRDVNLVPSAVLPAQVSISHPQLRDLILPLRRGHVLYPQRSAIFEQRWDPPDDAAEPSAQPTPVEVRDSTASELFKLSFVPTCITTNGAIFACGGQKAELFLCDLPQEGLHRRAPPVRPFQLTMRLPSGWINNAIAILPSYPGGWAERQAECRRRHAAYDDDLRERDYSDSESYVDDDDDDDGDVTSDWDIVDYDEVQSPAVATYPNSLPFGHAPRIPVRGGAHGHRHDYGLRHRHGPQYVTSRRGSTHSHSHSTASGDSRRARVDMPRILVSNNDRTVKMFSLRPAAEPEPSTEWEPPAAAAAPALSAMRQTQSGDADRVERYRDSVPFATPLQRTLFMGSTFGYDAMIGLNEGILPHSEPSGVGNASGSRTTSPSTSVGATELSLRGTRYLGESASAYRARNPSGDSEVEARMRRNSRLRQERAAEISRRERLRDQGGVPRRLSLVGGTRFKVPVNHASLSPDLRTMVTVGDSKEVYLYEAIDGGRQFRKIDVYKAATDWCFSTSWSKDGRKFAVASQDGQVTVWDHRSSRPLAMFFSSPSSPSAHDHDQGVGHLHQEEVTSSSGREAARVVKFSPEGSSRDLLVFSEEQTNIHIIDARTFDTHVVVPVPVGTREHPEPKTRTGVDSPQHWGISGVAFDPTGDWLYAGTERTVVEWDLRRYGGGEGGTWSMA